MPPASDWPTLLVGGAFVAIGLVFVPVSWRMWRSRLAMQRWPQAVAALRSAEPVRQVSERPHDDSHPQRITHACVLHYAYRVGGNTHPARDGLPARDPAHAAELAAQQPLGSLRPLHHDPQAPERYAWTRPSAAGAWLWLLPGAAFAGFGLLVLALA